MDDFSAKPGVPNFILPEAKPTVLSPGKKLSFYDSYYY
jgi:hypothetical protein